MARTEGDYTAARTAPGRGGRAADERGMARAAAWREIAAGLAMIAIALRHIGPALIRLACGGAHRS